jgi:hypothetical protein
MGRRDDPAVLALRALPQLRLGLVPVLLVGPAFSGLGDVVGARAIISCVISGAAASPDVAPRVVGFSVTTASVFVSFAAMPVLLLVGDPARGVRYPACPVITPIPAARARRCGSCVSCLRVAFEAFGRKIAQQPRARPRGSGRPGNDNSGGGNGCPIAALSSLSAARESRRGVGVRDRVRGRTADRQVSPDQNGVDGGWRGTHLNVLPCRESMGECRESMGELCSADGSRRAYSHGRPLRSSTRRALFDGVEGTGRPAFGWVSLGDAAALAGAVIERTR